MRIGGKNNQQLLYTNAICFGYIPKELKYYEIKKLTYKVINYLDFYDSIRPKYPQIDKFQDFLVELYFGLSVLQDSGCWIDGDDWSKYNQVRYNGSNHQLHRLSYKIFRGPILKPFVCHHCDKPGCVNPWHLFNGTSEDNRQDAQLKGRLARKKDLTQVEKLLLNRHLRTVGHVTKPWLEKEKLNIDDNKAYVPNVMILKLRQRMDALYRKK